MKILQINAVCGCGSTGRIATDLADVLQEHGHECRIAYGRGAVPKKYKDIAVRIGNKWDLALHGAATRLFDAHGFASKNATQAFVQWAKQYNPDIIHLHNIHGYYINIEILFDFIKQIERPVVWTLHDCWTFTGHCSHFTFAGCDQWMYGCRSKCVQKKAYPISLGLSSAASNFVRKQKAFSNVQAMTIVTPSHWLAALVKKSLLGQYPVEVIPNGIDLDVFQPRPSDFRKRHHLCNKKIILGVANIWNQRKGLNDFIKLSSLLDDNYKIVLVGLSQKQLDSLPKNILGLEKTKTAQELAEIYASADLFVNPTYEDTFPTTNLEAIACGTPVVTYDTGGSVEAGNSQTTTVIPKSIEALKEAIISHKKENKYFIDLQSLSRYTMSKKYLNLYYLLTKIN